MIPVLPIRCARRGGPSQLGLGPGATAKGMEAWPSRVMLGEVVHSRESRSEGQPPRFSLKLSSEVRPVRGWGGGRSSRMIGQGQRAFLVRAR